MKIFYTSILSLILISGCKVGQDFKTPEIPDLPSTVMSGFTTNRTDSIRNWWENFNDSALTELVVCATTNSPTFSTAVARLQSAQALLKSTRSEKLPQFATVGSYSRTKTGGANVSEWTSNFGGNVAASWELDLFGGISRRIEESEASWLESVYNYHDVIVSLTSELANSYVAMRQAQARLKITQENLKLQEQSAAITQKKYDADMVSGYDLYAALAQVASTKAAIPSIEKEIAENLFTIDCLTGFMPYTLHDKLTNSISTLEIPEKLPTMVSNELLRERPDIRRQEAAVRGASARIGIATAELYPKLTLSGSLGISSPDFSPWNSYTRSASFGPSFSWNLFSFGMYRQIIKSREADFQAALSEYRETVLNAYKETETAWSNFNLESKRTDYLSESAVHSGKSLEIAIKLYQSGETDYLNVIDSQKTNLSAQEALINNATLKFQYLISLYKSLGGGEM